MPYCYCHNDKCEDYDIPQTGNASEAKCGKCNTAMNPRPDVPPPVQRARSAAPTQVAPRVRSGPVTRFYCQNPNQSGDTTGVGFALALFDEMGILFSVSRDTILNSVDYLTYYQDMGAKPERIVLLIGDEEALPDEKARKKREEDREKERNERLAVKASMLEKEVQQLQKQVEDLTPKCKKALVEPGKPEKQQSQGLESREKKKEDPSDPCVQLRKAKLELSNATRELRDTKSTLEHLECKQKESDTISALDNSPGSAFDDMIQACEQQIKVLIDSTKPQAPPPSELTKNVGQVMPLLAEKKPDKKPANKKTGPSEEEVNRQLVEWVKKLSLGDSDDPAACKELLNHWAENAKAQLKSSKAIEQPKSAEIPIEVQIKINELKQRIAKLQELSKNAPDLEDVPGLEQDESERRRIARQERRKARLSEITTFYRDRSTKDGSKSKEAVEPNAGPGGGPLAELSIEMFELILRRNGWPEAPLVTPNPLVPSVLQIDMVQEWCLVDPMTATDQIRTAAEDNSEPVAQDSNWLASEPQPSATSDAPLSMEPTAPLKEKEKLAQKGTKGPDIQPVAEDRRSQAGARWVAVKQVGVRLNELLLAANSARCYGLYKLAATIKGHQETLQVIARNEKEAKEALTGSKPLIQGSVEGAQVLCPSCAVLPPDGSRKKRYNYAKDLLMMRLWRRAETARSYQESYDALINVTEKPTDDGKPFIRDLAGRIVPWTYRVEMSGNQLYQDLTNLSVKLRQERLAGKPAPRADQTTSYQTLMRMNTCEYLPIGDTSRNILGLLQREGLASFRKKLYTKLQPECIKVGPYIREKFLASFLKKHEPLASGRRITIVLIWVRGLNEKEMKQVHKVYEPSQIGEEIAAQLDPLKRNPHHVTSPQLARQLVLFFEHFNRGGKGMPSPDEKRYFVPVPIGDPVYLDQYDRASEVIIGRTDDNMIELWRREGFRDVIGGPHFRYRQIAMASELFDDKRFDLIQMGIRSGALEQGMYLGVPTIYLEEEFCGSGDRMVALTMQGPTRGEIDKRIREMKKQGAELDKLSRLREAIDLAALGQTVHLEEALQPFSKFTDDYKAISEHLRSVQGRPDYDVKLEVPDPDEPKDGINPPDHSLIRRGFPHFYRLVMKHLVGLHQARDKSKLDGYLKFVNTCLETDNEPTERDREVYKGGLQYAELKVLWRYCNRICRGYPELRKWAGQ